MAHTRKSWTKDEDKLFYDGFSTEEIMKITGRNYGSVDSRRYRLLGSKDGVKKPIHRTSYTLPVDMKKYLYIDGKKMANELAAHHLTHGDIAEALGIGKSSMSTYINSGYIAKTVMLGLEQVYNIKYDNVKRDEPVVVDESKWAEVTPSTTVTVDYDKLAEIIEKAVYNAVSRALNEPCKCHEEVKENDECKH